MTESLLLTFTAAGQVLGGVSKRTVQRMVSDGELQRARVRGRVFVTRASVMAYVQRQAPPPHNRGAGTGAPGPMEVQTCRDDEGTTSTGSIKGRARPTGGRATQTDAAAMLAARLGLSGQKIRARRGPRRHGRR